MDKPPGGFNRLADYNLGGTGAWRSVTGRVVAFGRRTGSQPQRMARSKVAPSAQLQSLISHSVNTGRSEGFPVALSPVAQSDGSVTFGVDIGSAPVPSKRYAADACEVDLKDGNLRMIFAQRGIGDEPFESALVIKLNPLAARNLIESVGDMDNPTVAEIAEKIGEERRPLERVARARQMVSVVANFVTVAVAGFETCVDFYHASAFSIRAIDAKKKTHLGLEPVVRVDITTGLFMAIQDALEALAPQLPGRLV